MGELSVGVPWKGKTEIWLEDRYKFSTGFEMKLLQEQ